ncbi:hypothetical protein MHYP_G00088660 [Metynnis hypsauchen]
MDAVDQQNHFYWSTNWEASSAAGRTDWVDRNVRKAELKSSIFGVLVERSIRFEGPCPVSEGAGVVGEVSLAARTEAGVGAVPPHIAPVRLSAVGADPALILRLKELELELQQQLNRALEIETEKAVKLRQLELEAGNARQPVQEVYSALSLDYEVVKSDKTTELTGKQPTRRMENLLERRNICLISGAALVSPAVSEQQQMLNLITEFPDLLSDVIKHDIDVDGHTPTEQNAY